MEKVLILKKEDLVEVLKEFFDKEISRKEVEKPEWLRSKDVRKMLNISDSTLQTMRINGSIPAYKLGDSWFYKRDEIIAALEAGKIRKEVSNG